METYFDFGQGTHAQRSAVRSVRMDSSLNFAHGETRFTLSRCRRIGDWRIMARDASQGGSDDRQAVRPRQLSEADDAKHRIDIVHAILQDGNCAT